MPRSIKETVVEPIPQNQIKEWNALIKETRQVVLQRDVSTFDLVLLAGRVEKKYGENRIGRWAEEACIGFAAAKQYRWLFSKGLDEAFIEKWCRTAKKPNGLSYTLIREVAQFCGSLSSPYALEYLQYAVDHKVGVIGLRGYMLESTAPNDQFSEAEKAFKIALQDKQEHEGFSDGLRYALERIVEEHPESEQVILETVITTAEDIEKLKIKAGIKDDEEARHVGQAKRMLDKLKQHRRWLRENEGELIKAVAYGHEFSDELKAWARYNLEHLEKIKNTEVRTVDSTGIPEHELPSMKKAAKAKPPTVQAPPAKKAAAKKAAAKRPAKKA
jgi:hypothetical protein